MSGVPTPDGALRAGPHAHRFGGGTTTAQATAQATAAQALATAANKSINALSVTGVNNLLGVSLSAPTTADALAGQAAALQTKP